VDDHLLQVWFTNFIVFGLAYWELDRGGPVSRTQAPARRCPGGYVWESYSDTVTLRNDHGRFIDADVKSEPRRVPRGAPDLVSGW